MTPTAPAGRTPGWFRRLASAVYDALLVTAFILLASLPVAALAGDVASGWRLQFFRLYVFAAIGAYFIVSWSRGGQTLALKTWRMRIERADGAPVTARVALHRFLLASLGALLLGAGYLWAFFDRDKQFLHDRLAGTRLIDIR